MPVISIVVTGGAALAALILSRLEHRGPYALAKGIAAAGFVSVALASSALATASGGLVLAGLVASGAGDVALAFRARAAFVAGMGAFALAHVAYAFAFALRGLALPALLISAAVLAGVSGTAWYWLAPGVPGRLRPAVAAYVLIISAMVALAVSSAFAGASPVPALGAVAFYLSDLAVARERFVSPGFANKLWGLPLYYAGQVAIALGGR